MLALALIDDGVVLEKIDLETFEEVALFEAFGAMSAFHEVRERIQHDVLRILDAEEACLKRSVLLTEGDQK